MSTTIATIATATPAPTRSTGPKTEEGKTASRRNALKHGLSGAGAVLPPDLEKALEGLVAEFTREFPPANQHEAWLVRQVALSMVRMDRCAQLEFALEAAHRQRDVQLWEDNRELAAMRLGQDLADDPVVTVIQLRRSSHGCEWLAAQWALLAGGLEDKTCLWVEADVARVMDLLGVAPEVRHLHAEAREYTALASRCLSGDATAMAALRGLIEARVAALEARADELWEQFEREDARRLVEGLRFDNEPDTRAVRRLEAAARRVFDRGLKELTALQADRRAATVAAEVRAPATPPPPPPPKPAAPSAAAPRVPLPWEIEPAPPNTCFADFAIGRPNPPPRPPGKNR